MWGKKQYSFQITQNTYTEGWSDVLTCTSNKTLTCTGQIQKEMRCQLLPTYVHRIPFDYAVKLLLKGLFFQNLGHYGLVGHS